MNYFIYLSQELFKELSEEEILVYFEGGFACGAKQEYMFSKSIMEYKLQANTKRARSKIGTGIAGLVEKDIVSTLADDVYLIKKPKECIPYFSLYYSEFEKLKYDNKLLHYFCFILSKLNNKTQRFPIANSIIEKEFGITNKTAKTYNGKLEELGLIKVIVSKTASNRNKTNEYVRLTKKGDKSNIILELNDNDASETLQPILVESKKKSIQSKNKKSDDEVAIINAFAEVVHINPEVFGIARKYLQKANDIGIEQFIAVIKRYGADVKNIFSDAKYMDNTTQKNVNIAMGIIFGEDLNNKLSKMEKEKEKIMENVFVDCDIDDYNRNLEAMEMHKNNRQSNKDVGKNVYDSLMKMVESQDELYSKAG